MHACLANTPEFGGRTGGVGITIGGGVRLHKGWLFHIIIIVVVDGRRPPPPLHIVIVGTMKKWSRRRCSANCVSPRKVHEKGKVYYPVAVIYV